MLTATITDDTDKHQPCLPNSMQHIPSSKANSQKKSHTLWNPKFNYILNSSNIHALMNNLTDNTNKCTSIKMYTVTYNPPSHSQTPTTYVLPLIHKAKFHTHLIHQIKLWFCVF